MLSPVVDTTSLIKIGVKWCGNGNFFVILQTEAQKQKGRFDSIGNAKGPDPQCDGKYYQYF